MSESDTRAKLIDPAIHKRGWTEDMIKREETAGAIEIYDGKARKKAKGRIDYTLRIKVNRDTQPVAVALIEAKAEHLPPNHGLEQAKQYADCNRMNVKFVFSTNGHMYVEYDRFAGLTSSPKPISAFPSPAELQSRYESGMGFKLSDEKAKPLLAKYTGGEATRRYYQDAAIRAVFEKIAKGEKRALLSLATGAGKTFIAVNLLKRIADAGQLKKALFVCDRDELRRQATGAFQNLFGANAAAIEDGKPQKNARIIIATYQSLDVDNEEATANFLADNYPVNYFSHIVIDECHRSAWGKWSEVLKRNPDAIQIGLTATPRQLKVTEDTQEAKADLQISADNLKHFGEPVYEYDMSQGIEDGYLAACEIIKRTVNLDETGITVDDILARKASNANTGAPVSREDMKDEYYKKDYEAEILLPERVKSMCCDLFWYLLNSGSPEQKTIIFCARDRHADDVAAMMNNIYTEWCKNNGKTPSDNYAFKCTAKSDGGDYLPDFRGSNKHHFIATTVDLLTTGVDVPIVRNIVFFKYVKSPISFYQMVGRGTRLAEGKLMFRVYDYTDATRLFGEEFITAPTKPTEYKPGGGEGDPPTPSKTILQVEGFDVQVSDSGRYIVTMVDGKAMPVTVEEYKARLAQKLVEEAPSLDIFRDIWVNPARRRELIQSMPDNGRSVHLVRSLEDMSEFDLYDVLADLAYGLNPKTRNERSEAFEYKHTVWLDSLPSATSATLKALASQFSRGGTEGLENPNIFRTNEVRRAGGLEALKALGHPADVLKETKERMFAA